MNCRTFEMQVADWIGDRLPARISARMAEHKAACASCAKLADKEADFRRLWSDWRTPVNSADLWPKLEARIAEQSVSKPARGLGWLFGTEGRQRTAGFDLRIRSLATAACAIAVLVPVAIVLNLPAVRPAHHIEIVPPRTAISTVDTVSKAVPAAVPTLAVSLVGDDAQGDPSIDDPIGGAMEHVWTHVSTYNKDTAAH